MSHQKKSPDKVFGLLVLCRMPCIVSEIPINQRQALPELERKELCFFDGMQWNRTDKGREVVKNGVLL